MKFIFVVLAAGALSEALPATEIDRNYDSLTGFAKWEKAKLLDLKTAVLDAKNAKVRVYEGLPHHFFESRLFRREASRTDVFWVHEVPFYRKPLKVTASDEKLLSAAYLEVSHHRQLTEPKLCGGFHPDYYVVWQKGSKWIGVMICLGCGEWISLNSESYLYEDMSTDVWKELGELLRKYASQRPKEEMDHDDEALLSPPTLKEKE